MFRLSFSHTLSIRTWHPLTYWDIGKQKKLFSYSKKKKETNWSIPKHESKWLTPISIHFPTCTDVLPFPSQTKWYSFTPHSKLSSLILLKPTHHFIILFLSINSHFNILHFFLFWTVIFISYPTLLILLCCPSKRLTHTSTNHLHYFRNYSPLNWHIPCSYVTSRNSCS